MRPLALAVAILLIGASIASRPARPNEPNIAFLIMPSGKSSRLPAWFVPALRWVPSVATLALAFATLAFAVRRS